MRERSGPLSGVRVLDLGRVMAAPWSTQILADLGADVVKVERPGSGDDTRRWGPPFLKDENETSTGESGYFLSVNRGKRSLTLDIAHPKSREILRRLIERSDILIENFKAGALSRFGLDADTLRTLKPSLIYCSVTGFGQDGPRREQAAYDFAIQAMGGVMSVTGEREGSPGGGPQKVGVPIIDLMTGMYATAAILAALHRRSQTGLGETIDIAMLDVSAAILSNQALNYLISGQAPRPLGNKHPNIQPQDLFHALDGDFVLAVGNDAQFSKLCAILDRNDLAADPRFSANQGRVAHSAELTQILSAEFSRWTKSRLVAALDAAGVPAAPLNDLSQVFEDPQIRHRRMVQDLTRACGGVVPSVVSPIRMRDSPLKFDEPPPRLGEHTREILAEIGFGEEQQDVLSREAVT